MSDQKVRCLKCGAEMKMVPIAENSFAITGAGAGAITGWVGKKAVEKALEDQTEKILINHALMKGCELPSGLVAFFARLGFAFAGAAAGALAGKKAGKVVDESIVAAYRCPCCGKVEFRFLPWSPRCEHESDKAISDMC